MAVWGTPVEIERRNRILLSIAAYAYEYENISLVSDEDFDAAAQAIDLSIDTGNPTLDEFFRKEFSPSTGLWIRKHPDLLGIANRFRKTLKELEE